MRVKAVRVAGAEPARKRGRTAGREPERKPERKPGRQVERELVRVARRARRLAHAPYSGFHVGAALLGASGRIYRGANIENASYGLTVCAERTAMFEAVLSGERKFVAVAVVTDSDEAVQPCGACRQVLREFVEQGQDLVVLVAPRTGPAVRRSLEELLPDAFFDFPRPGARVRHPRRRK